MDSLLYNALFELLENIEQLNEKMKKIRSRDERGIDEINEVLDFLKETEKKMYQTIENVDTDEKTFPIKFVLHALLNYNITVLDLLMFADKSRVEFNKKWRERHDQFEPSLKWLTRRLNEESQISDK